MDHLLHILSLTPNLPSLSLFQDGMDWSAYSPNERDEYQERKRAKKKQREREKKEQERRERERRDLEQQRLYEEDRRRRHHDDRRAPPQDDETFRSEYTEEDYYRRPSRGDDSEYTEDLPYEDHRDNDNWLIILLINNFNCTITFFPFSTSH
jgi:hypothetical protein